MIKCRESDVFKKHFNSEKDILEKFQNYLWTLGCFICRVMKGILLLFSAELARAPQAGRVFWQGLLCTDLSTFGNVVLALSFLEHCESTVDIV